MAATLAAALLLYIARSSPNNPQTATRSAETAAPAANAFIVFLKFVALLVFSMLLLWFAVASDDANLWSWMLWARSPFLGVRIQSLLGGAACGAITQLFRTQLTGMSRQAFDATIGSKESTAWVLQGALAILIVAAVTFAIKPDLLSYVRSLEYGGFKATFAEHSTTTRVADLNYKELLWGFTLDQYSRENFGPNYVNEDSDRATFGDLFFNNNVSKERRNITNALFKHYLEPIIGSLVCLESNHPTGAAAHDPGLIRYGARWVTFLTRLKAEPSKLDFNPVQAFLGDINKFAQAGTEYVNSIVPACHVHPAFVDEVVEDTAKIWLNYNDGLRKLIANGKTESSFQTLAMIEPYLVAATADLIVVLDGQKEKAEFLTKMLDGFPKSSAMMTPGIVNIFYQTADAQLKSFASWPVDSILANIDFAIQGTDLLISKTSNLVSDKSRSPDPTKFFQTINRNLMILLAEKLGLFNQRALAGEPLSQASREEWLRTYSRLIAILSARSDAPILAMDHLPAVEVNKQSKELWPSIDINPEYLVDVDLATAISSILLEQTQGGASALACNTALYYLSAATAHVDMFLRGKRHEADQEPPVVGPGEADEGSVHTEAVAKVPHTEAEVRIALREAAARIVQTEAQARIARREADARIALTELKMNRILAIINNWVGSACDWKPDLG